MELKKDLKGYFIALRRFLCVGKWYLIRYLRLYSLFCRNYLNFINILFIVYLNVLSLDVVNWEIVWIIYLESVLSEDCYCDCGS